MMGDEFIAPRATAADLTPREIAVAALIARAMTDKQISYELGIKRRTVRTYVTAIAFAIHANPSLSTRIQIALWWREQTPDIHIEDAA